MKSFQLATAEDANWQTAAETCAVALSNTVSGNTLGFLYVTDHLAPHFGDIAAHLRSKTGIERWIGSVGIGVCATGVELFDTPGVVAMAGEFPAGSVELFGPQSQGDALQPFGAERPPYFGVVHADPRNPEIPQLLTGLAGTAGTFFVGGLASSRRECPQLAGEVTDGGLSGALFSQEVAVATRLSQGCSPISGHHEVTRAERNVIFELDGRPALEALAEAAGELLMRKPRELGGRVFVGLPVSGTDTGDYLVRNLVGLDMEAGVIAIGESIEPGRRLLFCRRDADTARNDLERMVNELKSSLPDGTQPRGAVYFSCLARGPNLFGPDSAELKLIENLLGPVPLAGFFANGEVSNDRLYAYTGVLTVFT